MASVVILSFHSSLAYFRLTAWTKVRTALTNKNTFDLCFAAVAGLIDLAVDAEVILIFALWIYPIDSRSTMFETVVERGANGTSEGGNFEVF
jgi:hypothetical protein